MVAVRIFKIVFVNLSTMARNCFYVSLHGKEITLWPIAVISYYMLLLSQRNIKTVKNIILAYIINSILHSIFLDIQYQDHLPNTFSTYV